MTYKKGWDPNISLNVSLTQGMTQSLNIREWHTGQNNHFFAFFFLFLCFMMKHISIMHYSVPSENRIISHNFKWLWNVWHVLMTSKNVSLNAFFAVCSIRAIRAFLVRFFATFPAQMSLQVSFPSINPATFTTTMRHCWSHIWFLMRGEDLIPNSFCSNFMESSVQRWELVSCKTCKN
jgi:hypothetical protein